MKRDYIINHYLSHFEIPRTYLEIGVDLGVNIRLIDAEIKDGVDPNPKSPCNHIMTSDKFFSTNVKKYDVIFIDGLHIYEQVYKDLANALKFIKPNGMIIMHDCNPVTEWQQRDVFDGGTWFGTTWKAFVRMRMEREDLGMFVVNTDCGVGVVNPSGRQKPFRCSEDIYNYKVFEKYRKEALNLISVGEFEKLLM